LSYFINGIRACDPMKIEIEDGVVLFPQVVFKGCLVSINFGKKLWFPPPFIVRSVSEAAQEDSALSTVKRLETEPEVIFPIGFNSHIDPWVQEFAAAHPEYTILNTESCKRWFEKSGVPKNLVNELGKHVGQLHRRRNFVVCLDQVSYQGITEKDRKELVSRFLGYKKIAMVLMTPGEKPIQRFAEVTLPEETDGFNTITYVTSKEETLTKLEAWKEECRLRSFVSDLEVSAFFKEKMAAYDTLAKEKKENAEAFTEFKEEDYILSRLRAEMHYLIHGFLTDAGDEKRTGICVEHFNFYYKKYQSKDMNIKLYGFNTLKELIKEYADDAVEINEKEILISKYEKDIDPIQFLELEELSRQNRVNREDAGDERAKLKFKAAAFNAVVNRPQGKLQPIPGQARRPGQQGPQFTNKRPVPLNLSNQQQFKRQRQQ